MDSVEKRIERLCKKLVLLGWNELRGMGVNIQQIQKIKRGEKVVFRKATLARLEGETK